MPSKPANKPVKRYKMKPGPKPKAKKTVTRPVGSPTKYRLEYCQIAKALASKGFIDIEICNILDVSNATLIKWKKEYPDFLKAIKEGKAEPDDKVISALYENAIGGEYEAEKALVVSDGGNLGSHVEIAKVKERVAPNVAAQIFWLKNRKPENWKDKQDIEHSGSVGYKVIPDDVEEIKED